MGEELVNTLNITDDLSSLDYSVLSKSNDPVFQGYKLYGNKNLKKYDSLVLGFTGKLISNSDAKKLISSLYRKNLSSNHLDIGPGSGYFLDNTPFPTDNPKLVLSDIHPDCLSYCAKRLTRYNPLFFQTNILSPFQVNTTFDSISMNWVLHCIPGQLNQKLNVVCRNIVPILNRKGTFFGSTVIGKKGNFNFFGNVFNYVYNWMGVFSNLDDDVESLKKVLEKYFDNVNITIHGSLALFSGVAK